MRRTIAVTHKITDITAKTGASLRYIHAEIDGALCTPLRINKGERGWIAIEPTYDTGSLHRLHTSEIQDIEVIPGQSIVIETENTMYTLMQLPVPERREFKVKWDKSFEDYIGEGDELDLS